MSTLFSFQSQLVSIMDALSKTAVLEISKLVEIESKMLKIEITRGRNEIASLTEKLQLMENLLWVAQGQRQEAAEHTKTSGGRDDSVNSSYGRLDLEKIPTIKSEKSCESISSSTQPRRFQQSDERPSGKLTSAAREQPELILVKEEPVQVETGHSGIQSEMANERQSNSVAETQSRDADRRVKVLSDKQPVFTETFVTLGTQSSTVRLGRQDTQWNPHVHSEYQDTQLPPVQANLDAGKSFARNLSAQGLSKNVKIHSLRTAAAKRFSCLQCGKSFRCFSQLEIHQRSHTGEKPFRCTLCGKRYAQKGHLYTHQRTHTGEKPYRCPICGKGFIQKCTLDMHQRTHTGEKPFVCVKCGKGFTKNCNLKKHLAVHIDPSTHLYSS